jgi:hypothetical protein
VTAFAVELSRVLDVGVLVLDVGVLDDDGDATDDDGDDGPPLELTDATTMITTMRRIQNHTRL